MLGGDKMLTLSIMTKLAIIIPNRNDSRFLINVIKKFAAQKPAELIIVDDHSDDRSLVVLKELQEKYDFKIVNNEGIGVFSAFIAGCLEAKSEYVSGWSCDDEPKEDYIETMEQAIEDYPFVDMFTCNAEVLRENKLYKRTLLPFDAYISPDYMVKLVRNGHRQVINPIGTVIKKDIVLDCWNGGGCSTTANFDCMYTYYAALDKGFINLADYLVLYRSYSNSFGAKGKNEDIKKALEQHKKYYKRCPVIFNRACRAGIFSTKERLLPLLALWVIPKLPYFIRERFYRWLYTYDSRREKL